MSVFHFKQFDVRNEKSAMKVNTDGVLLGVAVTLDGEEKSILDCGTGTGTIALILAQRSAGALVTGIDVDGPSVEEAELNFSVSPWAERLKAERLSVTDVAGEYDLIVSNPPYFDDSLQAFGQRRNFSRHTGVGEGSMSYREVFLCASRCLSADGRVAVILPSDQEMAARRFAAGVDLCLSRVLRIRTTERKVPKRIILEFTRVRPQEISEELLTMIKEGRYTPEYISLVQDFYLLPPSL